MNVRGNGELFRHGRILLVACYLYILIDRNGGLAGSIDFATREEQSRGIQETSYRGV